MPPRRATTPKKKDGPLTKVQIYRELAERTGMSQKDIVAVFDQLEILAISELKRARKFALLPGRVQLTLKDTPAKPPRMGYNPQTRTKTMLRAKPASRTIRARALKRLKEAAM